MNNQNISFGRSQESVLATNKVLKNTYMLLSMTLIFSGVMAAVGMSMGLGHGAGLVANIAAIGLLWFALPRTANTTAGIPVIFLITGLFGLGLGRSLTITWRSTQALSLQRWAAQALYFWVYLVTL